MNRSSIVLKSSLAIILLGAICFSTHAAQPPLVLTKTINHPDGVEGGYFGQAVNSFNGNILVGATGFQSAVYVIDPVTGASIRKLTSPDAGNGAVSFGDSMLQVGQNIAVADGQADFGSNVRAGAAYIFNGTTGQPLFTLHDPSPQTFGYFGSSLETVAGKLLVSAGSPSTAQSGNVLVFNPTTGQYQSTIPNPEPGSGNYGFGFDMAQHQGNVFVSAIGGPAAGIQSGAVYRFDGTTLTQNLKISCPNPQDEAFFGWAIDRNNTQLLVGAPNMDVGGQFNVGQAYLFDVNTGALLRTFLNPEPNANMQFGQSLALVGNYAVIGAPFSSVVGAAYVFDANTGACLDKFYNPGNGVYFGGGNGQNGSMAAINGMLVAGLSTNSVGGKFNVGSIFVYAVPEPGSFAILAASFSVVVLGARRRRFDRVARP